MTVAEHLRELQGRLVVVALVFIAVAALAYPFFDHIVRLITAPLKGQQELVYLTPGGAFTFVIQVCIYIGLIGVLPVLMYQSYRFAAPAIGHINVRRALGYAVASLGLALAGVVFAYAISLPAALHFLTNFNLSGINPMLTIDSYLSFVMTYLLAGALLFQLPLIMMIFNNFTPLTPGGLMKHQGKIILGSFIVAAIISPTPDAVNQTLLAAPLIVMYQVGILIIWGVNRSQRKQATALPTEPLPEVSIAPTPASVAPEPPALMPKQSQPTQTIKPTRQPRPSLSMNGFVPASASRPHVIKLTPPARTAAPMTSARQVRSVRTLDGFYMPVRIS